MIVFQMYNSNYCSDSLLGTYVTPVPEFVNGYLQEKQQQMQDMGADDYEFPDVSQYTSCTPFQIQGVYYYFQMGCADDSSRKLAVNIYSDKDCTTRSAVDGYDDSNIDVSDIRVREDSLISSVTLRWALTVPYSSHSNSASPA